MGKKNVIFQTEKLGDDSTFSFFIVTILSSFCPFIFPSVGSELVL